MAHVSFTVAEKPTPGSLVHLAQDAPRPHADSELDLFLLWMWDETHQHEYWPLLFGFPMCVCPLALGVFLLSLSLL